MKIYNYVDTQMKILLILTMKKVILKNYLLLPLIMFGFIMPNQLNIIAIYAFGNIEYQSNAWAVPYRTSPTTFNTIGNPGESYGTTSLLAQALGVYGGLVMLDTGDLINS
jgi:hypothetical protein